MKKSIIAVSAASVALAAMPIAGVFADVTDEIEVTVADNCAVTLDSSEGKGRANGSSDNAGTWTGALLKGSVPAGQYSDNFGTTNMTVTCNKNKGFVVTATPTVLTASTATGSDNTTKLTIPVGAIVTDGSASAATGSDNTTKLTIPVGAIVTDGSASAWSLKVDTLPTDGPLTNNAASWITGATNIITASEPVNAGTFKVIYGVSISSTQAADTYTGSVTYTVANPSV